MGSGKGRNKRINKTLTNNVNSLPEDSIGKWEINDSLLESWLKREKIAGSRNVLKHYTGQTLKTKDVSDELAIEVLNKYMRDLLREGILTNGDKIKNPENYLIVLKDDDRGKWGNYCSLNLFHVPTGEIISTINQSANSNSPLFTLGSRMLEENDKKNYYYQKREIDNKRTSSAGGIIQSFGHNINIAKLSSDHYEHVERNIGDVKAISDLFLVESPTLYYPNIFSRDYYNDDLEDVSMASYYLGDNHDELLTEEIAYILNESFLDLISYNKEERSGHKKNWRGQIEAFHDVQNISDNIKETDFAIIADNEYVGLRNNNYFELYLTYKGEKIRRIELVGRRHNNDISKKEIIKTLTDSSQNSIIADLHHKIIISLRQDNNPTVIQYNY